MLASTKVYRLCKAVNPRMGWGYSLQLRDGTTHLGTVPSMEPNEDTVTFGQVNFSPPVCACAALSRSSASDCADTVVKSVYPHCPLSSSDRCRLSGSKSGEKGYIPRRTVCMCHCKISVSIRSLHGSEALQNAFGVPELESRVFQISLIGCLREEPQIHVSFHVSSLRHEAVSLSVLGINKGPLAGRHLPQ